MVNRFRKSSHEIDPLKDRTIEFETTDGTNMHLTDFRSDPAQTDSYLARGFIGNGTGIDEAHEVRIPKRLEVAKDMTVHFVERHKKGIIVVGTIATTIAAGSGIIIHKYRHRDD
jgi:hypothetical protein